LRKEEFFGFGDNLTFCILLGFDKRENIQENHYSNDDFVIADKN
jgi:hypothetical protein